jgi:hypothetical protein
MDLPRSGRRQTPPMVNVLIDGENVRRSTWPNLPRGELVERVAGWAARNGHDAAVIWEGRQSADEEIAARVRDLDPPVWVVTSDRELRRRVATHTERVIGGGSFLRELA